MSRKTPKIKTEARVSQMVMPNPMVPRTTSRMPWARSQPQLWARSPHTGVGIIAGGDAVPLLIIKPPQF